MKSPNPNCSCLFLPLSSVPCNRGRNTNSLVTIVSQEGEKRGGESVSGVTHPFSIQKEVNFEVHAVVHRDLLVPVEDLKYAAVHGAIVDPCRAEAAFSCCDKQT